MMTNNEIKKQAMIVNVTEDMDFEAMGVIVGPLIPVNSSFTCEETVNRLESETMTVDNPIQRAYKWETRRASLFIHSVLINFPVLPLWAKKEYGGKDKKGKPIWRYDVLDGKQRLMSVYKYMKGEYALKDVPPVVLDNVIYYIDGLKFDELPEELQKKIKDYKLTFKGFDNVTDFELKEIFKRLNNGKALTGKEKSIANCSDIDSLTELGKHQFFTTTYTEKSLEQRKQIAILMKIYLMLRDDIDEVSFENADMFDAMERNITTEADRREISRLLDKALAIYNEIDSKYTCRKFASETNFVSLVPFIKRAMDMEMPDSLMADFVQEYFGRKVSVSDEYSLNAKQGSGKSAAIVTRNTELEAAWAEFFAEDDDVTETSETPKTPVTSPEKAAEVAEEVKAEENIGESEMPSEDSVEDEKAEAKEYRYGMRLRDFDIAAQPMEGLVRQEDDETGKYHDILVYDRELTEEEVKGYELDILS